MRAGQIRRSQPPGVPARLFLIAQPAEEGQPVCTARLLTPDTDMDTGAEQHLPADPSVGRHYDLLVHEFPTYLDPALLGPVLWEPAKSEYRPRYSDLADSLRSGSVRWRWKLAELDNANAHMVPLCCLFGECEKPHARRLRS